MRSMCGDANQYKPEISAIDQVPVVIAGMLNRGVFFCQAMRLSAGLLSSDKEKQR